MGACIRGLFSCFVFLMTVAAGHCATYDINIPTNPYDFITFGASGSLQTDASGVVTLSNVHFTMTYDLGDFTGFSGGDLAFNGTIDPPLGGSLSADGSIGFLSVSLFLPVPLGWSSGTANLDSSTFTLAFDIAGTTGTSGHDLLGATISLQAPIAAATPLPAALPLFATGLGALGLLGWRRKKKATAHVA